MAKKSMIARDVKRKKMAERYAAKRAALIKYLHSVMGTSEKNRRRGVDEASAGQARGSAREQEARKKERIDGGTGFLDGSVSVSSSYEDDFEPDDSVVGKEDEEEPVTVRLGQSGIGDEEVHALVAVLTSRDKCDLLDLRGNSVGDVGARGLATVRARLARVVLLAAMARPCHGAFTVTGGCGTSTNAAGQDCFTSPNYPSDYGNDEACSITASASGALVVEAFETESGFDELIIDGTVYEGTSGPARRMPRP